MLLTLLLSLVFIAAMTGLLYAAVGLIQNKKLFTSAPKDIQAAVTHHPERFPRAHALGWKLAVLCMLTMIGVFAYAGFDGVKNGYTFWRLFIRYITILYIWKVYDIVFFDRFLLTKTRFFQHFYPETEGCEGYRSFGFNRKAQLVRILLFPFAAALVARLALLIIE